MKTLSEKIEFDHMKDSDWPQMLKITQANFSSFFHWNEEQLSSMVDSSEVIVARLSGFCLAFLIGVERGEGLYEIIALATDVQKQKSGLMIQLTQWLFASKVSLNEVWLEVHESNKAACKLYEKLGFQQVGFRANYYSDGKGALQLSKFFNK